MLPSIPPKLYSLFVSITVFPNCLEVGIRSRRLPLQKLVFCRRFVLELLILSVVEKSLFLFSLKKLCVAIVDAVLDSQFCL